MDGDTISNDMTIAGGEGSLLANRYRIIRQLGQGGMGSVWLVEDTQLDDKPFAIKMLPAILVSNKRAYRQLKDEALVAMRLVHPNIVQIRAFEENNGNPFLVMDYVDGQTLDDYLADCFSRVEHVERVEEDGSGTRPACPFGGISEAEVLRILRPIAAALDYAHGEGVVHRDVKPANVMIRKDGHPFILDFGIAREIQETMTRVTGKLSSGTLLYMSPEQLMGEQPKPAQDVYSFAAMVYECLKGEPPFAHGQIEFQIMNKQPEPLPLPTDETPVAGSDKSVASPNRAFHRGSGTLAASVMAGLAKKPEDRPATCAAVLRGSGTLAASVGAVNGSGTSAASPRQQLPGGSRSRATAAILVVPLLVIVGGVWLALSRTGRSPVRESSATSGTDDASVQYVHDQVVAASNMNAQAVYPTNNVLRSITGSSPAQKSETGENIQSLADSTDRPYNQRVLATVRAEMTGHIKEICVKSGDLVEKGQVLFKLDDEPLRIAVVLRKAELKLAETECRRAERYWERIQKADARGITQKERDDAETGAEKSRTALLLAQANLRQAEFELKKANIVAPVSGKIRLGECIGDAVSPDSPFLAEILSSDSRIDAGDGTIQELDVYPRTKGRVTRICVDEGQVVKGGDVLCLLGDESITARVEICEAELVRAEAERELWKRQLERKKKAADNGTVSRQSLDDAEADAEKSKAKVDMARAQLGLAEYEYVSTKVVAPASGKITRINVRIGDVVDPDKTVLVKMSRCTDFGTLQLSKDGIEEPVKVVQATKEAEEKKRQAEIEAYRRRLYPEYYAQQDARKAALAVAREDVQRGKQPAEKKLDEDKRQIEQRTPIFGEMGSQISSLDLIDAPLIGNPFDQDPNYERCMGVDFAPVRFAFSSDPDNPLAASEHAKIEAVAEYLQANPDCVVIVEGNCDERGSNEYNLSLGEFRASSIRDSLVRLGIDAQRIQTRSYGEEKPAMIGENEAAWSKNRRGEFAVFRKK